MKPPIRTIANLAIALSACTLVAQYTPAYTLTSFDVPFAAGSNTKFGIGGGPHGINPRGNLTGLYEDSSGNDDGFLAIR